MAFRIKIKKSAGRELASLPKRDKRRVVSAIEALAADPPPEGVRKLVGAADAFRIRVGDYRILYRVAEGIVTVFVIRIDHRKDAYRSK